MFPFFHITWNPDSAHLFVILNTFLYPNLIRSTRSGSIPGTASSVMTSYNNGTSVSQSYTYQQTLTTEQSFTWSVTESLSVGIEISATEGVPCPEP